MTQKSKSPDEIEGFEYDWLCCDEDGYVGMFSTAGAGYAPRAFLQDTEAHERAIAAILSLPPYTTSLFAPEIRSDLVNTWKLLAERGLYAYDSNPNGGPYLLVAKPSVPVRVTTFSSEIADVVGRIKLPVRFPSVTVITEAFLAGIS